LFAKDPTSRVINFALNVIVISLPDEAVRRRLPAVVSTQAQKTICNNFVCLQFRSLPQFPMQQSKTRLHALRLHYSA